MALAKCEKFALGIVFRAAQLKRAEEYGPYTPADCGELLRIAASRVCRLAKCMTELPSLRQGSPGSPLSLRGATVAFRVTSLTRDFARASSARKSRACEIYCKLSECETVFVEPTDEPAGPHADRLLEDLLVGDLCVWGGM